MINNVFIIQREENFHSLHVNIYKRKKFLSDLALCSPLTPDEGGQLGLKKNRLDIFFVWSYDIIRSIYLRRDSANESLVSLSDMTEGGGREVKYKSSLNDVIPIPEKNQSLLFLHI